MSTPVPNPTPPLADASPSDAPAEHADEVDSPQARPDDPGPADTPLDVELILQTPDTDPPAEGWLPDMLFRAAREAGVSTEAEPGSIRLLVVDDTDMAVFHEQYCGVPGTTDVITFDHRGDPSDSQAPLDADLVLCVDEARRQAARRGHDVRLELLLYAVHGMLHLLGEDDHDPADYEQMHAREDAILRAMGLGPVFRSTGEDAG